MDLTVLAWISIAVAFTCAFVIVVDEIRRPQAMGIMNIVWPVTALYLSVFALWAYFALGTKKTKAAMQSMKNGEMGMGGDKNSAPTLAQIAEGTSHCGSGCMIADVGTEFAIAAAGLTLFGKLRVSRSAGR